MHGCGVKLSCDDSGHTVTQEGLFEKDDFVGPSSACDAPAAQQAARQAVRAAHLACGFEVVMTTYFSKICSLFAVFTELLPTQLYSACSHRKGKKACRTAREHCRIGAL